MSVRPSFFCRLLLALATCLVITGYSAAQEFPQQRLREKHTTADFVNVKHRVAQLVRRHTAENVLVVVDIDNTLLAMNQDLGSDQWFNWQNELLTSRPQAPELVAADFSGLLRVQGTLFALSSMHPPEPALPELLASIQQMQVALVVMTSRGPEFRNAAERELDANQYDVDNAKTVLQIAESQRGLFQPYDPAHPNKHGLTADVIAHLGEPRSVTYANGIFMIAGQHKGYLLRTLLARAIHSLNQPAVPRKFQAIVFVDDHQRHTDRIHQAFGSDNLDLVTFRYSREDGNVSNFNASSKRHVVHDWSRLKDYIDSVLVK